MYNTCTDWLNAVVREWNRKTYLTTEEKRNFFLGLNDIKEMDNNIDIWGYARNTRKDLFAMAESVFRNQKEYQPLSSTQYSEFLIRMRNEYLLAYDEKEDKIVNFTSILYNSKDGTYTVYTNPFDRSLAFRPYDEYIVMLDNDRANAIVNEHWQRLVITKDEHPAIKLNIITELLNEDVEEKDKEQLFEKDLLTSERVSFDCYKADKWMLLRNGTGSGKTYLFKSGKLVDTINQKVEDDSYGILLKLHQKEEYDEKKSLDEIKQEWKVNNDDILILETRRLKVDQMVNDDSGVFYELTKEAFMKRMRPPANKIAVCCSQAFGSWIRDARINDSSKVMNFKVIAHDELQDYIIHPYMEEISYSIDYILNYSDAKYKIGMTANPEVLETVFTDEQLINLDARIPSKNKSDNVKVFVNKPRERMRRDFIKTYDTNIYNKDNRVLFCDESAKTIFLTAQEINVKCWESGQPAQAMFICSSGCNTTVNVKYYDSCEQKIKEDKNIPLSEVINNVKYGYVQMKEELVESGRYPDNIIVCCINLSVENGFDINDTCINDIWIRASDSASIVQLHGRVRHNTKNCYLYIERRQSTQKDKNNNYVHFSAIEYQDYLLNNLYIDLEKDNNPNYTQLLLKDYYCGQQTDDNRKTANASVVRINLETGDYYIDERMKQAYLRKFINYKELFTEEFYEDIFSCKDKQIIWSREFINIIGRTAEFHYCIESEEIPQEYLNKPLYTEDKKELMKKVLRHYSNKKIIKDWKKWCESWNTGSKPLYSMSTGRSQKKGRDLYYTIITKN